MEESDQPESPGGLDIQAPKGWRLPIYDPSGEKYGTVEADGYQSALESGYRIPVISPEGKAGSIGLAGYDDAIKHGFKIHPRLVEARQAVEDEKEGARRKLYGERPIAAGTAGALRSLSLGVSDIAGPALGVTTPEELKGLKEYNEAANLAGETGALAASMFVPGLGAATGIGAATKAGKAAVGLATRAGIAGTETVAKRLAGRVITGAAETALFGAGQALSEYALGDHELNGEKIAASIGLSALLGAGIGGGAGLVGETSKAVSGAVTSRLPKIASKASEMVDRFTLKSLGALKSDFAKLSKVEVKKTAEMLRARGHIKGTVEDAFESIGKDLSEQTKKIGAEAKVDILESGRLTPLTEKEDAKILLASEKDVVGGKIGESLAEADASGAQFHYTPVRIKLRDAYKSLNPAQKRIAAPTYENMLRDMDAEGGKIGSFGEANGIKSTYYDDINWQNETKAKNKIAKQFAGIFNGEIEKQLEESALSPGVMAAFRNAKRVYGIVSEAADAAERGWNSRRVIGSMIEKAGLNSEASNLYGTLSKAHGIAERGMAGFQGNRLFGLGEKFAGLISAGIGGLGLGAVGAAAGAGAGALASKVVRQRGPSFFIALAQKLSGSAEGSVIAQHFAKAVERAPKAFGAYASVLSDAAARGPVEALAVHLALSQSDPEYVTAASMAGFPPLTEGDGNDVSDRARGLAVVKESLDSHDDDVGRAIRAATLSRQGKPAPTQRGFGPEEERSALAEARARKYKKRLTEIREWANNPMGLADKISVSTGEIGRYAPALVASASSAAQRAVVFLNSKIQQPSKSLAPLAPEWTPSNSEISKFSRYYEVVMNPKTVLKHAALETMSAEHVDALRAVYPRLYEQMRNEITMRLSSRPKNLKYGSRVLLGMLAGMDPDGTLNGKSILRLQARYSGGQKQQGENGNNGVKPTRNGAKELTLAKRFKTPIMGSADREV